jgi:hypothetical protein
MLDRLTHWLKRLGYTGIVAIVLLYVLFWAYSLPRTMKVHVTGTEVTRRDVENKQGELRTRDVRYVMTEDLDGDPHMFRNEDTGWGWPPYFKFDSGDVAARAQSLATEARQATVLVRYYGFRLRLFSMFPNVISLERVPPDHQTIPWAAIFVVFLHVVLIGAARVWWRVHTQERDAA